MLWQRGTPPSTDDEELATRAPVQTGFPATFTVHLYQPPPTAARRSLAAGEPVWARAVAAAVPAGIPADYVAIALGGASSNSPGPAGQAGIDANHWIVYLDSDARAGSLTEWWLGASLPAGFHLMDVAAVNPQCITADQLAACEADLAARGVSSSATAEAFCKATYRLSPANADEQLVLQLGSTALGPPAGTCP
jgi:hypothetical protein